MKQVELQHETIALQQEQGLWKDGNFLKLWTGQSLSMFGSQITTMALPLVAVMTLNATPFQMGVLHAAEYAPFLLFGLIAGVWVDRLPKRPLLIAADLGRALLFGLIPLLALFGSLNIALLCTVAFLAGILTTLYSIGYQSILPYMLGKGQLIDANAKMEFSRSVAGVTGPGLAGLMVQWMTGVFAIVLDALSFVVSGILTSTVSVKEPQPKKEGQANASVWKDMGEGLRIVFGSPCLRSIAACSATTNFFLNMTQAILILYATKELGFTPVEIGLLMTLSSSGAVLSALMSSRLVARFGFGPVITGSAFCQGIAGLFLFGAAGGKTAAFTMLFISMFLMGLATTVYNVAQVSFRQSITEPELLGRMNATMRFIVWGVIPLGAFAGGSLGTWIGLYPTILTAVCGGMLSFLWVFLSPVRTAADGRTKGADA
ncbi:arabinose efflux permease family protein [Paenibacillus mucilaginosus 3016]|uniref:Arabinose efflux permease family protein n=1 Tax=Paenibacillus mucilaginosus 3016 TaxID=1116391 RepID=H6NDI2_9BACL|nr:MFS transporter [Paenibacillus mucilaginosus]AFC31322.1 arabinose efflux permease family protein [Paenibacillus mucilaginosus 3016]WFA19886.1 MFS transporter [Paenibacillus mucilaginosus]